MGLFSIWAKQNKRDHDMILGSQMIDIEKSVVDQDALNIHIGSGGLLNATDTGKSEYLSTVRAKITDDDLIRLESIFKLSSGRDHIFKRVEEEGIPLVYLVALGITSQEDIQSYLTVKERGIDIQSVLGGSFELGVDTLYAREILSMEEEYPRLRNIHGDLIPDISEAAAGGSPAQSTIQQVVQSEDRAQVNEDVVENSGVEDIESRLNLAPVKETVPNNSGEKPKTVGSWQETLAQIVADIQQNEEVVTKEEAVEDETPVTKKDRDRQVYVLADNITLPEIPGYRFIQVTSIQGVNTFTAHRDNLLVITRQIPKSVANHFMDWLKGVKDGGDRYRIVTLESSSVRHDVIEDVINLTKEDLDNYYVKHDSMSYIGDGVGSFMDISSVLK